MDEVKKVLVLEYGIPPYVYDETLPLIGLDDVSDGEEIDLNTCVQ